MEWPTVVETLSVSAHRQVELAPWPAAAPAALAGDAGSGEPVPHDADAAIESGPERDAW
jgi:hypothetical protein